MHIFKTLARRLSLASVASVMWKFELEPLSEKFKHSDSVLKLHVFLP